MDASPFERALLDPDSAKAGTSLFVAVRDALLGTDVRLAGGGGGGEGGVALSSASALRRPPKPRGGGGGRKTKANPVGANYKQTLTALSSAILSAEAAAAAARPLASTAGLPPPPLAVLVDALAAAVACGAGMSAGASSSSESEEGEGESEAEAGSDADLDDTLNPDLADVAGDDGGLATDAARTPPSLAAVVAHLLAEVVPPAGALPASGAALRAARPGAAALFSRLVVAGGASGAKLGAKVAANFALAAGDVDPAAWTRMRALVPELMLDRAHQAAAVRLLMQFPRLAGEAAGPLGRAPPPPPPPLIPAAAAPRRAGGDADPAAALAVAQAAADARVDAAMAFLVDEGQEALAERWAASLARERRAAFVRACVDTDRLKAAARAVQLFGLQREFPGAERAYRERSVARMAGRRLWPVALGFVRGDRGLQRQLLTAMAESGETQLAATYADQLGYFKKQQQPEEQLHAGGAGGSGGAADGGGDDARLLAALRMDPAALVEAEARRRAEHLQLLPRARLVVVDGPEALARAAAALAAAPIVALDVEWRPGGMLLGPLPPVAGAMATEGGGSGGSGGDGGSGEDDEGVDDLEAGAEEDDGPAPLGETPVATSGRSRSRSRSRSRRRRRESSKGRSGGQDPASSDAVAAARLPKEQAALLQVAVWGLPARNGGVNNTSGSSRSRGASADHADDDAAARDGDVFLFDLPALAGSRRLAPDLDACLAAPFASDAALVLGFEAAGDLAKLASSWPEIAAFRRVTRVLDVRALWVEYVTVLRGAGGGIGMGGGMGGGGMGGGMGGIGMGGGIGGQAPPALLPPSSGVKSSDGNGNGNGSGSGDGAAPPAFLPAPASSSPPPPPPAPPPSLRALTGAGLSTLCRALLGAPLDKSMQLSDWMARPLTARQVEYAAADAQVLPRLRARLREELGPAAADAVERRAEFTFAASGGGGGGGGQGARASGAATAAAAAATTAAGAPAAAPPDGPSLLLALLEQHGLLHCARRQQQQHQQQQQVPAPLHAASTLGSSSPLPPPRPPRLEGKAVALLAGDRAAPGGAAGRPVVAVARAGDRIDLRKLAHHLRVQRRGVRVASRRECLEIFGYAPGTVPPVGHDARTTIVVDYRLGGQQQQHHHHHHHHHQQHHHHHHHQQQQGQPALGGEDNNPPIIFGAGDEQLELALTFSQLVTVAGRDAAVADVAEPASDPAATAATTATTVVPQPPPRVPAAATALSPAPPAEAHQPALLRPLDASPKFLIDSMCGRLGRWLRCLGLDALSLDAAIDRVLAAGKTDEAAAARAAVAASSAAAAAAAAACALSKASPSADLVAAQRRRGLRLAVAELHARREGRVLLTRDAQLATSREGLTFGAFMLASDNCVAQLAELASHFGRDLLASGVAGGGGGGDGEGEGEGECGAGSSRAPSSSSLLTRCSVCNSAAYMRIGREEARAHVPARALAAVEAFWRCDDCARVVWWGPKSDRAVSDIRWRVAQALAMLDAREQQGGGVAAAAADGEEAGGGHDPGSVLQR